MTSAKVQSSTKSIILCQTWKKSHDYGSLCPYFVRVKTDGQAAYPAAHDQKTKKRTSAFDRAYIMSSNQFIDCACASGPTYKRRQAVSYLDSDTEVVAGSHSQALNILYSFDCM